MTFRTRSSRHAGSKRPRKCKNPIRRCRTAATFLTFVFQPQFEGRQDSGGQSLAG